MWFTFFCWMAVAIYCGVMIFLGFHTRVRSEKDEPKPNFEFWMAKRELPGWRLGTSLASGWLMLGWIGFGMSQIYLYGATGLWILPIPWFVLCFIILAMVPYVRRIRAVSLPQAMEKRYGKSARLIVALFSVYVFLSWTQAELFVGGILMSSFLSVPPFVCMTILAATVGVYMWMGGFRASVLTDITQFFLMAFFMIFLLAAAYMAAKSGSGGNILGKLAASTTVYGGAGNTLNLFVNGMLFPVILMIGYLPGWMTEQDLLLRIQAAPTTREAYKGAFTGFFLITVFVIAIPAVVALFAIAAFPPVNGMAPGAIGADAMNIIPSFISVLPAPVQVFMLVGIMGCQMSTVDTFANVAALPISYDIVDPALRKRGASERMRLHSARVLSIIAIAASLFLALISRRLGDVYYISSGVLSASIAVPAIFLFWHRTTLPGVVAASVTGFAVTIGMYWFEMKHLGSAEMFPLFLKGSFGYIYVAAGVVASVAVIVPVSLLTAKPSPLQLMEVDSAPCDSMSEFDRIV